MKHRPLPKAQEQEVIYVHDSDSEPEERVAKRQKTVDRISSLPADSSSVPSSLAQNASTVNEMSSSSLPSKKVNIHLRGRKRFIADLSEMGDATRSGYMQHGMRISSTYATWSRL